MPKLHAQYETLIDKLECWKPGLRRNFAKSVFCALTFNFGPQAICRGHRDFLNWAPGGCIITAGGHYDYTKGGHLVIVELKLIFEFPPGCSIIIPSACLTHGNLPIASHEHRVAITQYTAGGLFRWVDYGCRTAKDFAKADPHGKEDIDSKQQERWMEAVNLYSTLDELKEHWEQVTV